MRPELNDKPVVVLSNNDGCAISRTIEAKSLGVKMGAPLFEIHELCMTKGLVIFSSNFSIYTNISKRVMNIITEMSPYTDVYSVDEAFTFVSGISDLCKYAKDLKDRIYRDTGIPVSIGIGKTKVLAKAANRIAKKSKKSNGIVILDSKRLENIALKTIGVSDIWGIGTQSAKKLNSINVKSAYEFKEYKNENLIQKLLTKVGLQIKHELMGISCFCFDSTPENKKEIMCSRTFGSSVFDKATLKESIANYMTNASAKMREQNSLCMELSVFARTNPFKEVPQFYMFEKYRLKNPTCDTRKLIKIAFKMIDKGFRSGYEYKKAGVKLSGFYASDEYQLDLLSEGDSVEDIKLMKTVDDINLVIGQDKVRSASCGFDKKAWEMNRRFKSPRYFTCWEELKKFS
jgi:DNA polymerase V